MAHHSVQTEPALPDWRDAVIRHGAGRTDAILLRHAWRADTPASLAAVAELAAAAALGHERRAEILGQGIALALPVRGRGAPLLETFPTAPAYTVSVGALDRAQGVPEYLGLLHAFTANLVSAAVRLIPLGQTAGLRILHRLEPTLHTIAAETRHTPMDDIGNACFRSDIAAMRHEMLYTRLFANLIQNSAIESKLLRRESKAPRHSTDDDL